MANVHIFVLLKQNNSVVARLAWMVPICVLIYKTNCDNWISINDWFVAISCTISIHTLIPIDKCYKDSHKEKAIPFGCTEMSKTKWIRRNYFAAVYRDRVINYLIALDLTHWILSRKLRYRMENMLSGKPVICNGHWFPISFLTVSEHVYNRRIVRSFRFQKGNGSSFSFFFCWRFHFHSKAREWKVHHVALWHPSG